MAITALAMLLFAIPLGIVIHRAYRAETITTLQRDAAQFAAVVPDTIATTGGIIRVPQNLTKGITLGVYTIDGRRLRGHGPAVSTLAAEARDGDLHELVENSALAVSAPVPANQRVVATVRAAISNDLVTDQVLSAWAIMAGLAVLVIGLAALLARRQAGRIARPLETLTRSAEALGSGDFTVRNTRSGIVEADAVGAALDSTGQRLADLLERERAFSTHVSHQLRTPLTALLLGLESATSREDADLHMAALAAIRRARQLENTINDVLRLARDTHPRRELISLSALVTTARGHWHGAFTDRGRQLRLAIEPDIPEVAASEPAIRQVMDVLVGNALTHGRGTALIEVRDLGGGVQIDVSDQGRGISGDSEAIFHRRQDGSRSHGIGLALARSLAEAEGGRLIVRRTAPHAVFSILLPVADAEADQPSRS
ncbi:MAG: ATP-binding protein [Sciscionella sp.]